MLVGAPRSIIDKYPLHKHIVLDMGDCALGDGIARVAAALWVARNHPGVDRFVLLVPKFFLDVAKHLAGDKLSIYNRAAPPRELDKTPATMNQEDYLTTLHTHLAVHAAACFCDRIVPVEQLEYPSAAPFAEPPKEYEGATLVSTGWTSPNRQLAPETWNELLAELQARGHKIVFIGRTDKARPGQFDKDIDYSVGVDLRDKTTLLEVHAIMTRARVVLGVDGGLLHLAACTPSTPVVIGYTAQRPETRLPVRGAVLGGGCAMVVPSQECRFCQSDTHFLYDNDYRYCAFGDYLCTRTMPMWKWQIALESLNAW